MRVKSQVRKQGPGGMGGWDCGGGGEEKKMGIVKQRLILEWNQPNGKEDCRGAGEVLLLQTSSL
jgi:hypothetical protein